MCRERAKYLINSELQVHHYVIFTSYLRFLAYFLSSTVIDRLLRGPFIMQICLECAFWRPPLFSPLFLQGTIPIGRQEEAAAEPAVAEPAVAEPAEEGAMEM